MMEYPRRTPLPPPLLPAIPARQRKAILRAVPKPRRGIGQGLGYSSSHAVTTPTTIARATPPTNIIRPQSVILPRRIPATLMLEA